MSGRNFRELLEARWSEGKLVCVGLDSKVERIPSVVHPGDGYVKFGTLQLAFNCAIVEATKDLVCAYKLNPAFYLACGESGLEAMHCTIGEIHDKAPEVAVILDGKFGGGTPEENEGYAHLAFRNYRHWQGADAVTVNPYPGAEALEPFLARADKGVFVLCRTSNPGAGEFQDLWASIPQDPATEPPEGVGSFLPKGRPLYQHVAYQVTDHWNKNNNCGLVVGATYPDELREIRGLVGDMPILIPGIGEQGGDLEATVQAGKDSRGKGMIINSSRGVIFASSGPDFAEAARREVLNLQEKIDEYLRKEVPV